MSLYRFRWFIFGSIKRDFQLRYKNSLLGVAWIIINPLSMILIYTVIFSQIMHTKLPSFDSKFAYSIYLCSGTLAWGLFAEITQRCQLVFIDNANLIKKISLPKICLPLIVLLNALLGFSIVFGLFTIFLLVSGNFPGMVYLCTIPILIVQVFFALSLGMILGILNVFFRDIGQLFNILLQFWFWATPIVYPTSILPELVQKILYLNPMAGLIKSYQQIFVLKEIPDWTNIGLPVLLSIAMSVYGVHLYKTRINEVVDEL